MKREIAMLVAVIVVSIIIYCCITDILAWIEYHVVPELFRVLAHDWNGVRAHGFEAVFPAPAALAPAGAPAPPRGAGPSAAQQITFEAFLPKYSMPYS